MGKPMSDTGGSVAEHATLAEALAAFQDGAPTLVKDQNNPAFKGAKYVPLDSIVQTIQPRLTECGLVWAAYPDHLTDGTPSLHYELTHVATGDKVEGEMPLLLDKRNSQGLGSAITYARRYALTAVLNLVADEDDDGNKASSPAPPAAAQHKDDVRPAAPRIPVDRAQAILQQALRTPVAGGNGNLATLDMDAAPGTPPVYHPTFKAVLGLQGVAKIGDLNVDSAEAVEAFLRAEGEGQG
jgi:hypothetical protein